MYRQQAKLLLYVFGVLALTAFIYVYYTYDPSSHGWFPKCPVKGLTGLDCPGCGSQRAIHALLHGDFMQAFHYNALVIPFIPYIVLGFLYRSIRNPSAWTLNMRKILFGEWAIKVIFVVILLHFFVRNMH
ncbi:DUF2752 domain-containing protein [Sphingobacterium sp. LRF_L2]|uniref:DUF2752 domain-containing protein n=1 Tax=Sphingobacterium sp. LRF_L2 TaxID=3369421 RepID=UPI003F5D5CF0